MLPVLLPERLIDMRFGAVAIGRNEGARLRACLSSLSMAELVVYVDSGSNDSSVESARRHGAHVVTLEATRPFTAARARNAGLKRLREVSPSIAYVQFIDGDCELIASWPREATSFLETHPEVAVVAGRLHERAPDRSIYNWLCEREWQGVPGQVLACGGIAMMRIAALETSGAFREDLIAGEEPELCVRLRLKSWEIWRLDSEMATHDAAMTRFSQWWKRTSRAGYAYAQGSYLHGHLPERHGIWESHRSLIWAVWIPLALLLSWIIIGPWALMGGLAYPLQMWRQIERNEGRFSERATLALFQTLSRFAEAHGQLRFWRDRLLARQPKLIEYK